MGQNWAKLSLLVHTSMPPLGTDGVGGDLSKGPVAMDPTTARYTRGNHDKLDVTLTRHAHSRRSSHPRV